MSSVPHSPIHVHNKTWANAQVPMPPSPPRSPVYRTTEYSRSDRNASRVLSVQQTSNVVVIDGGEEDIEAGIFGTSWAEFTPANFRSFFEHQTESPFPAETGTGARPARKLEHLPSDQLTEVSFGESVADDSMEGLPYEKIRPRAGWSPLHWVGVCCIFLLAIIVGVGAGAIVAKETRDVQVPASLSEPTGSDPVSDPSSPNTPTLDFGSADDENDTFQDEVPVISEDSEENQKEPTEHEPTANEETIVTQPDQDITDGSSEDYGTNPDTIVEETVKEDQEDTQQDLTPTDTIVEETIKEDQEDTQQDPIPTDPEVEEQDQETGSEIVEVIDTEDSTQTQPAEDHENNEDKVEPEETTNDTSEDEQVSADPLQPVTKSDAMVGVCKFVSSLSHPIFSRF